MPDRYRIYNMHGKTVWASNDLEKLVTRLTELNDPRGNAGPYRLINEEENQVLTKNGWMNLAQA
jgi:hypothetical protein